MPEAPVRSHYGNPRAPFENHCLFPREKISASKIKLDDDDGDDDDDDVWAVPAAASVPLTYLVYL